MRGDEDGCGFTISHDNFGLSMVGSVESGGGFCQYDGRIEVGDYLTVANSRGRVPLGNREEVEALLATRRFTIEVGKDRPPLPEGFYEINEVRGKRSEEAWRGAKRLAVRTPIGATTNRKRSEATSINYRRFANSNNNFTSLSRRDATQGDFIFAGLTVVRDQEGKTVIDNVEVRKLFVMLLQGAKRRVFFVIFFVTSRERKRGVNTNITTPTNTNNNNNKQNTKKHRTTPPTSEK